MGFGNGNGQNGKFHSRRAPEMPQALTTVVTAKRNSTPGNDYEMQIMLWCGWFVPRCNESTWSELGWQFQASVQLQWYGEYGGGRQNVIAAPSQQVASAILKI